MKNSVYSRHVTNSRGNPASIRSTSEDHPINENAELMGVRIKTCFYRETYIYFIKTCT